MTMMTQRYSHLEAEAEEETCQIDRRMMSTGVRFQEPSAGADSYAPPMKNTDASPKMGPVAQAPHDPVSCDFNPVCMAEAEEHSLAIDRRQMSVAEAEAMGGKRRVHTEVVQPTNYAVETPQNSHHLAGLAEAEEMAWGMDRQVSAAGDTLLLPAPRRIARNAATAETTESAKEALDRRCSHTLAASAEAEELAYALDRQASVTATRAQL